MTHARAIPILILLVAGCGAGFQHPTPKGFVELEDQRRYDYRAITADGMVLAVRALDHEPQGELEFWTEAIANHMRMRGGYALLGTSDVQNASGLTGAQLRFGHDEGQKPHLYYVTVFVTEDTLYLLEAGGTKEQVEQRADAIDQAVREFRVD